ncbi:MAG: fructose-6-phosphate aldolase [Bernardetiaceae bacterium]
MKFFIDTADLQQIEQAQQMGILDGVTTNPSLMAKVGISGKDAIFKHYKAICDLVVGDVSAEVIATDYAGIVREGEELAEIDPKIVVKVPMIPSGIRAIYHFTQHQIKTNCTLVFSPLQALLAAKAGATYVSPFIGRLDDIATDGLDVVGQIATIFENYAFPTQVLAASIRHPMHLLACAEMGVDVATLPFAVIESLFKHPLTDAGLAKFLSDAQQLNL